MFAQAPTWDTSGDSMLTSNSYYFREVTWTTAGGSGGGLSNAQVIFGSMTFSGSAPGTYSMSANYVDGASGSSGTTTFTGTYSIGAGGFGFLTDPLQSGSQIRGMVSKGVFIGSSTESSGYNNLFIAGQIPSPTPTASSFSGTFTMAYMNYANANPQYFEDAQFTLTPNGSSSVSQSAVNGFYSGNGTTATGQAASTLKYTASNGAMVVNFPTSTAATLVNGQEYLYFSPDGNFVFGGSPTGFDMLVGVKNASGNSALSNGLWYNAGVYQDASGIVCANVDDLVSYYGSFDVSGGTAIKHQRLFSSVCSGTYSSISTDANPSTDPTVIYIGGDGGIVRIGVGQPPYLGLDIALAAPSFSGSGVYLNPTGILNNGSYAPFTAGVSPGEIIALFGTNLAPGNAFATPAQVAAQLPTQLDGVQVLIDGLLAPLYYVTPGQISAIVPYAASTFGIATIQVKNNGVPSNTVSEFVNLTTPGAFTYPVPNGISNAAADRYPADGTAPSVVTEANPAQPGDLVAVYVTGLGGVFPPITQDGTPGNANYTVGAITVDIGGVPATVGFAGLSSYPGLYQINITIPTGLTAGDNFLNIAGPDAFSSEALIPIGTGTAGVNAITASQRAEVQDGKAQKAGKHWNPRPSQKSVVEQP